MSMKGVLNKNKNKFKKIAKNNEKSMNDFLKKEIRKITDSYPDEIKQKQKKLNLCEVNISGLSPVVAEQFQNIAKNKGLTTSQLLNLHSESIISSYPNWMVQFEE